QCHRMEGAILVLAEEDRVLTLHLGEFGRERLDHADAVAMLLAETRGDTQVAVRDVVEQFVTGHLGSSRLSWTAGGPLPGKNTSLATISATARRPQAGRIRAGSGEKKGPSPRRRSLSFRTYITSMGRSELVAQAQHVARRLVEQTQELPMGTGTPADIL